MGELYARRTVKPAQTFVVEVPVIRFPLFDHLKVDNYGLYPGTEDAPGMEIGFQSGLTLILGANGLGKSTLVLLLYRMCTGPNDIQGLNQGEQLGNRQFKLSPLSPAARRAFAARVKDSAADAIAHLRFRIGRDEIKLSRNLKTLNLTELRVNDEALDLVEDDYQRAILSATGLTSFSDWILVLRYLTFYSEDRRSLVWDPTAQRQLLRLLFLPPEESAKWSAMEGEVLRADSHVRNLSALLHREEESISRAEQSEVTLPELEARIAELGAEQSRDQAEYERLNEMLMEVDSERQSARLEALRASEDREAIYREIERGRLLTLQAAFPSESESAGYILGYLLAAQTCLVCGSEVPHVAEALWTRIDNDRCVVCESPFQQIDRQDPNVDLDELDQRLSEQEDRLSEANKRRAEAEDSFRATVAQIAQIETATAARSVALNDLSKQLPPGSHQIRERRREYNALRSQLEVRRIELGAIQRSFKTFVEQQKQTIFLVREDVKSQFSAFARDFLVGDCELIWQSHRMKVGQSGDFVDFGTFEVDMPASDSGLLVRRTGAGQVSESQREFIDIAFRMALMAVAGDQGRGSLVVDAPETSLDAVFSPRAARVLMRFGNPDKGNRLIITSNLVDGELIPTLLREAGVRGLDSPRVVDLFDIAYPTPAVRELREEYQSALTRVFLEGER